MTQISTSCGNPCALKRLSLTILSVLVLLIFFLTFYNKLVLLRVIRKKFNVNRYKNGKNSSWIAMFKYLISFHASVGNSGFGLRCDSLFRETQPSNIVYERRLLVRIPERPTLQENIR